MSFDTVYSMKEFLIGVDQLESIPRKKKEKEGTNKDENQTKKGNLLLPWGTVANRTKHC